MAHASIPEGRVTIDAGAQRAITVGKKSLLLPGVIGVSGDFESGAVVEVVGPAGAVARGICRYCASELEEVLQARRRGSADALDHVAPRRPPRRPRRAPAHRGRVSSGGRLRTAGAPVSLPPGR